MALGLVNNVNSLIAQNSLNSTQGMLGTALQRLSTGVKLNSAADGPAAFVISNEQKAQVTGLQTALTNTNNAVNVVQIGEGALNEIGSLLNQARGLALDAANTGVNDATSTAADQSQISNALNTITQIANNTTFGTKHLLNGAAGTSAAIGSTAVVASANTSGVSALGAYTATIATQGVEASVESGAAAASVTAGGTLTFSGGGLANNVAVSFQTGDSVTTQLQKVQAGFDASAGVGAYTASLDSGGNFVVSRNSFGTTSSAFSVVASGGYNGSFASAANTASFNATAGANLTGTITRPDGSVSGTLTGGGTSGNVLTDSASGLAVTVANGAAGAHGAPTTAGAGNTTVTVSGAPLTFQIGANANQTATISFANMQASALGNGVAQSNGSNFASLSAINVSTQSGAQDSISVIDAAINQVSSFAGQLGAFQNNTLEANASNLQTTLQNTTSAESTITDTNYAQTSTQSSQYQVQLQAGISALSTANQSSQLILKLLG